MYKGTDAILLEIKRKILAAAIFRDRLIARQAEAERACFKAPNDPERSLALSVIDTALDDAHDNIARLAEVLAATRVTMLAGLQEVYEAQDVGKSLRGNQNTS